ncbi:TIGR04282 family arsenosugar biosynthesis glycosyltransferase [Phytoactinopolyspora mesophila]|uniref:DUF2064 domain-containing protein n=1 Tax=Phytoactinopolyspora mesophila TaxID=2650750 RepID=A0A7K3M537_9ACTN|nr:DUF2064 domain-containing protein [Phytoactinopolyspora mesophila]NDL58157.1 DUF2064 domain-containing protein [Phytoactinopolyspora mesophila]
MQRPHILLLAKSPVAGQAKTRLSPPYTPDQAAAIAEAALTDTLTAVAACHAERRIVALDGPPGPWLPPGFEVVTQVDGSLNERLAAAWEYAGGPGLQIGMDTPQITAALLDASLATVVDGPADAALGMAEDGGWWAIAFGTPHPLAFHGVPMSRSDTGSRQCSRLRSLGLTVAELPPLRDLDDAADAQAIAELIPGSNTARVLDACQAPTSTAPAPEAAP